MRSYQAIPAPGRMPVSDGYLPATDDPSRRRKAATGPDLQSIAWRRPLRGVPGAPGSASGLRAHPPARRRLRLALPEKRQSIHRLETFGPDHTHSAHPAPMLQLHAPEPRHRVLAHRMH
ncbi:hypothetical protein XACW160_350014 [Xanthomonas citri pv. citri]|uniref:Uncharacterized protein n=1 Tax=Xanthomonas citri pv. citri TaxID=611301 RepID=A0A0U5BSU3_XANCI|nr:hypothetical protein XAC3824_370016 [Xanthomonas citri pv. citri]CEE26316.1 hypothetical protein XAC1083_350007 [Xanthomonas citri pv. citri]CEE62752.1 hypothetical protein XACW160_350014 [Xanthomonas citri pv. citri]CEE66945.1 hypothetical protein XACS584_520002 [Xanthomonas citri pv. citri]CEE77493.1 hypothetical protein XACLC80_390007 [Xanthomonas citri pv. citri]